MTKLCVHCSNLCDVEEYIQVCPRCNYAGSLVRVIVFDSLTEVADELLKRIKRDAEKRKD